MLGRLGRFMRSNAIALVALFFALGGAAHAANTVRSSDIVDGAVRSVDIRDGSITPAKMAPAVRPRWARVTMGENPVLVRDRGAVDVDHLDNGLYRVTFTNAVVNCGWLATVTHSTLDAAAPEEGMATVVRTSATELDVRIVNADGVTSDLNPGDGFTVAAYC